MRGEKFIEIMCLIYRDALEEAGITVAEAEEAMQGIDADACLPSF